MAMVADSDPNRFRHYSLDDGNGRRLVIVFIIAMVVSTLVVGLRLFTRKRVLNAMGWDDYAVAAALICSNAYSVIGLYAVHYLALGKNSATMPAADIYYNDVRFPKFILPGELLYFSAMMFARASVILLIFRLQPSSRMVIVYKAVLCLNIAGYICRVCFSVFRCTDPSLLWAGVDLSKNPKCFILHNILIFAMVGPVINMVLDILVYTLPMQFLLKPGLHFKKRARIAVSFLVGILSLVGSIMVVKMASAALNRGMRPAVRPANTYMVMGDLYMWPAVEAHVACICVSVPVLGTLQRRITKIFWDTVSPKGSGGSEIELPVGSCKSSVNNNAGSKPKGKFEAYGVSDEMLETRRDSISLESGVVRGI